jgi:hypothetical protein
MFTSVAKPGSNTEGPNYLGRRSNQQVSANGKHAVTYRRNKGFHNVHKGHNDA